MSQLYSYTKRKMLLASIIRENIEAILFSQPNSYSVEKAQCFNIKIKHIDISMNFSVHIISKITFKTGSCFPSYN